jgi:DinB superfamily
MDLPVVGAFDPDAWAAERDHREGDFEEDWRQFHAVRAETVSLVGGLAPAIGDRPGLSSFFGPITLAQYATHVVDHDIEHLEQLARCRAAVIDQQHTIGRD